MRARGAGCAGARTASGCFGVPGPFAYALPCALVRYLARRSVAGIHCGRRDLIGRPGGRPISGLRPPRTPAPSRVGLRSRDAVAPPTRLRSRRVREPVPVNAGRTAHPHWEGRSDGVWGGRCCARAVDALVRSQAESVPGGGASGVARDSRPFARLAACKPVATTQGMLAADRRDEVSPTLTHPRSPQPRIRAPALTALPPAPP